MIDNLSIAVHDFARRILMSLSVVEMQLPRNGNLSIWLIYTYILDIYDLETHFIDEIFKWVPDHSQLNGIKYF